ncbi:MAG: hypothetical protein [Bacteriophage sp.]|nr:MAG: hypothetical protein [Bacteriophage sp.]
MTIVTKDPHTWFVAENSDGEKQTVYNNERYRHNYRIGFQINGSDGSTPAVNSVTLYNMSKEHREFYEKKQKCYIAFNWGTEKKILAQGFIKKVAINQSDGVTESFVIYFTEGTDYSNVAARKIKVTKKKKVNNYKTVKKYVPGHWEKKRVRYTTVENGVSVGHYRYEKRYVKAGTVNKRVKTRSVKSYLVNRTFKKGTTYKKIIQTIANSAGMKISKIQLHKNPKIKKAFTAKGKPLTLLRSLVKPTESKLMYIGGKLVIVDPKSTKRTWVLIDDKDLKIPPSYNETNEDTGEGIYEITIPLDPEVTINTGIKMKSKYLKGKYYVKAYQHLSDGEDPQTVCSLKAI